MGIDEEQLDRRVHWVQGLIVLLVGATVWCVKLEMNNAALQNEFTQYKRDMKAQLRQMDEEHDMTMHKLIAVRQSVIDHGWQLVDDQ